MEERLKALEDAVIKLQVQSTQKDEKIAVLESKLKKVQKSITPLTCGNCFSEYLNLLNHEYACHYHKKWWNDEAEDGEGSWRCCKSRFKTAIGCVEDFHVPFDPLNSKSHWDTHGLTDLKKKWRKAKGLLSDDDVEDTTLNFEEYNKFIGYDNNSPDNNQSPGRSTVEGLISTSFNWIKANGGEVITWDDYLGWGRMKSPHPRIPYEFMSDLRIEYLFQWIQNAQQPPCEKVTKLQFVQALQNLHVPQKEKLWDPIVEFTTALYNQCKIEENEGLSLETFKTWVKDTRENTCCFATFYELLSQEEDLFRRIKLHQKFFKILPRTPARPSGTRKRSGTIL